MRLLSVSSSRADLSIMGPVWDAALAAVQFNVQLLNLHVG
jgi:hypothetical protein